MSKHTLQIATLGPDTDPVLVGIRTLPVHKLYLLHLENDTAIAPKVEDRSFISVESGGGQPSDS